MQIVAKNGFGVDQSSERKKAGPEALISSAYWGLSQVCEKRPAPVDLLYTSDPNAVLMDVVIDAAMRCLSTTLRWLVP